MSQPQSRGMTPEEFHAFEQEHEERYELVDGVPQLKFVTWDGPTMMVGATQGHGLVALNAASELRVRLKGSGCRPFTSDGKVAIPRGNFRYPDVSVDCGPLSPRALVLSHPVLVIEVLSKSTAWIDTTRKLEDYKSVSTLRHILLLSQDEPRGQLWTRTDQWALQSLEGLQAEVVLQEPAVTLSLAVLYEGLFPTPDDPLSP